MGFGDIIKRAWHITWRYRALWVLGLFAGISGASTGGGSGYNSSSSGSHGGAGPEQMFRSLDPATWADHFARYVPAIVAGTMLLIAIGFVLWIVGTAARGGLIRAVDTIEEGRTFTLGAAWDAGFGRFWRLLGLSVLLGLPMAVVAFGLALAVAVPLVGALRMGSRLSPAVFAPMCGAFLVGVPLLIVGGVILGIMGLLGTRSIMLEDVGVFEAAGRAWRSFRTRIKDTLIMWFITLGLNLVAGMVVAIPLVIVIFAATVPAFFLVRSESWASLTGLSVISVLVVTVLLMLYTAIWGTFTSALWTIFFRRLTGREAPAELAAPSAPEVPSAPIAPEGAVL